MILETDPATIASRVAMRGADSDIPLAEQVCFAFQAFRPHLCSCSAHAAHVPLPLTVTRIDRIVVHDSTMLPLGYEKEQLLGPLQICTDVYAYLTVKNHILQHLMFLTSKRS